MVKMRGEVVAKGVCLSFPQGFLLPLPPPWLLVVFFRKRVRALRVLGCTTHPAVVQLCDAGNTSSLSPSVLTSQVRMVTAAFWGGCEDIRKTLKSGLHVVSALQMLIFFSSQDLSHCPPSHSYQTLQISWNYISSSRDVST